MASIYARWIKLNRMKLEDVPNKWRETVNEILKNS